MPRWQRDSVPSCLVLQFFAACGYRGRRCPRMDAHDLESTPSARAPRRPGYGDHVAPAPDRLLRHTVHAGCHLPRSSRCGPSSGNSRVGEPRGAAPSPAWHHPGRRNPRPPSTRPRSILLHRIREREPHGRWIDCRTTLTSAGYVAAAAIAGGAARAHYRGTGGRATRAGLPICTM